MTQPLVPTDIADQATAVGRDIWYGIVESTVEAFLEEEDTDLSVADLGVLLFRDAMDEEGNLNPNTVMMMYIALCYAAKQEAIRLIAEG